MDGGQSYEAYVVSYRRKVELDGKCSTIRAAISILDQFVTLFIINSPLASTPSQLQSVIANKRKELHDHSIST